MEQTTTQQPLLWEQAAMWAGNKLKQYRVPLLTAMIVGMLAHGFAFTNKLVNHDEVFTLFAKGGTVSLGRWGLGLLDTIFPNYSMPWIYGIITIALISIACCVIISTFQIRSKLVQGLLAGSILAFPSLTATFSYMFTASSYAVAFLLATVAVYLLRKPSLWRFVLAGAVMVASLSIYQAYIAIAASLLVLLLIQELLQGEDVGKIIPKGCLYVLFLGLSLCVYYGAAAFFNWYLGVPLNDYANGNVAISLTDIPAKIISAYQYFGKFFHEHRFGLIPTFFSRQVHEVIFTACAILLLVWGISQKKKQWGRFLLLAALVGILPLAINCMFLFTQEHAIHALVLYGFVAIYVLFAVVVDACGTSVKLLKVRRIAVHIVTGAMALVIAVNIYIANAYYLNMYLRYESSYNFYSTLIADIKLVPEFDEDMKLAIIGNYRQGDYVQQHFPLNEQLTGTWGFLPGDYAQARFLEYYLDFPIPFASDEEIAEISASSEYADMPVYPYYGSMKLFGDTLVVKLS